VSLTLFQEQEEANVAVARQSEKWETSQTKEKIWMYRTIV
jgi:hypothetical protein